jgi:ERCC4-type nuclease
MIIVFARYDYWGDNGRCGQDIVKRYESERDAIIGCCDIAAIHDMGFYVEEVVGSEDPRFASRIIQAVADRHDADAKADTIRVLKDSARQHQEWFDKLDDEIANRLARLERIEEQLKEYGGTE